MLNAETLPEHSRLIASTYAEVFSDQPVRNLKVEIDITSCSTCKNWKQLMSHRATEEISMQITEWDKMYPITLANLEVSLIASSTLQAVHQLKLLFVNVDDADLVFWQAWHFLSKSKIMLYDQIRARA